MLRLCICIFSGFILLLSGCAGSPFFPADDAHAVSPASQLIHFYRGPLNHFSAVRSGSCPMYPGCSAYGLAAIEKHGAVIGWIMMFDRLMRCGLDESHLAPEVLVDGTWKYMDTLEQNDFWWYSEKEKKGTMNIKYPESLMEWGISIEQ